jgi:hypothetical protein
MTPGDKARTFKPGLPVGNRINLSLFALLSGREKRLVLCFLKSPEAGMPGSRIEPVVRFVHFRQRFVCESQATGQADRQIAQVLERLVGTVRGRWQRGRSSRPCR